MISRRILIALYTVVAVLNTSAQTNKNLERLRFIADSILQTGSRINSAVMDSYIAKDSRESFIKSAVIQMMATPEYQLC